MIVFQGLTPEEIQRAFQYIEDAIDLSHRSTILFDYLDESFFWWFAVDEKHGNAFNHYKDQRELLDWSVHSLTQAYAFLDRQEADTYVWYAPIFNAPRTVTTYYLDNTLYRIFAALERAYSFCDYWFNLGFTEANTGKLFRPYRLFEAQTTSRHPEWANSELFLALRDVRESAEYGECIQQLRHEITHNLDPREYVVRYDQAQSLVEIAEPAVPVDKVLIGRAKKLLGDLFKIRGLEAQEIAQSMEKYGVRKITPADMDYWTDADSPLF
jgi:hypothetical protein